MWATYAYSSTVHFQTLFPIYKLCIPKPGFSLKITLIRENGGKCFLSF